MSNLNTRSLIQRFTVPLALAIGVAAALWTAAPVGAVSSSLVISQIYGGGGNSGATLRNDFVELYNRGSAAVDLAGWTVQYTSSTGDTWATTPLSGVVQPGRYYLVQEAVGAAGTVALPTPDAVGTIALSATAGKVALANSATALSGVCPTGGPVIDLVGYGTANCAETSPAATLSNTTAALRKGSGGTDTDNNADDFAIAAPEPRNSAFAATPTAPSGSGSAVPAAVSPGETVLLTVSVTPGNNPPSSGLAVIANLAAAGGSAAQTMFDDGANGDVVAGDGVFSFALATAANAPTQAYTVPFTVSDAQGRTSTGSLIFNIQLSGPQTIVISQVYGGGGNSGATLKNDFLELYNRGTQPVSVSGWTVQYLPASGSGAWQSTPLTGTIPPAHYYLIEEGQGTGGSVNLPIPDAIGTIAMSGTAAHVALVNSLAALPASTCTGLAGVVDFVGFGTAICHEGAAAAPAPSNTVALLRAQSGCLDTDNNAADFATGAPLPRNSQVAYTCGSIQVQVLPINQIQGTGTISPVAGQRVRTSGVVTGLRSNGFFIQTPDAEVDADPNTSEGVFVFTSTAPGRAIGDLVTVEATVQEFVPTADTASPSVTELVSPVTTLFSTGNTLPVPMPITPSDTQPAGGNSQLEKYEGMRVSIASLTAVAPTDGTVNEANATAASNGVFYGVLTGIARPVREAGIEVLSPLPPGAPAGVPRFDGNPERIRVDSDAQPGSIAINLTTGTVVTGLVGPLDYSFRTYTVLPDAATPPATSGGMVATPVSPSAIDEFTVASFNMERFFDTVDDPGVSDVVLTPTAFANRLNKASLVIRGILRTPDIIGVEEMENLPTLQALAAKVSADALVAGDPDPQYQAILEEGNDIGGIDVGFLVRNDRVTIADFLQLGKDTQFIDPNNGQPALLNDRPSLLLHAIVHLPGRMPSPVTVIVNHLRSLTGVDDPVDGSRIRAKRRAQAEFVANTVQGLQQANPAEAIVLVGDLNAFALNDGYVDVVGTILGSPAPADQVVLASPDLVEPNLLNLVTTVPLNQQYSYVFDGNAQELDHVIVNTVAAGAFDRLEYGRANADFPESFRSNPNRPERLSDHDMVVAYFKTGQVPPPDQTPPVLTLPANISVSAIRPSGTRVSYEASATDAVDGSVPVECAPSSGSRFAITVTTVTCTASDARGNVATGSFTITVTPPDTPGEMIGNGFVREAGDRHEFTFFVRRGSAGPATGYLQYAVIAPGRGASHDDRFQSTAITSVSFFDAPGSSPGGGGASPDRTVFEGTGIWNGRDRYTFTARALDAGEPGRGRDVFAITVRDPKGVIVADLHATIDGGNIQSVRVRN